MEELSARVDKKIDTMQVQVVQIQSKVAELKQDLDTLKVEVDHKMDNFHKKLDTQLNQLDLSPEDQAKVKEYFKAFIGTFSSVFVTSQVIESGQISLDVGTSAGSLLSTLASFVPFAGDTLSSAVTTIDEFLSKKEMKTKARRMLGLCSDSTHLSSMIGKTAYEIVIDPTKRGKILSVTDKELNQRSGNVFQKIRQFCEQMSERVIIFLYTKLYSTASARLGHMDANSLIEIYFKGEISLYGAQEQFVEAILSVQKAPNQKEVSTPSTEGLPNTEANRREAGKTSCCSIF